jgi:DNA-binding CsgD family transcriptional regulator
MFEALGTPDWVRRTLAELERLPGTSVRPGIAASAGNPRLPGLVDAGLTPTEETVASLAAQGLTNREIADRTFLSPKTVEVHLTRVYRKLGVRSRAMLASRFAARP